MRIVFMGTPNFAAEVLEALVKAGHEIALAVTQPDKPKGRGQKMLAPAVKLKAQELNIEVAQPQSAKDAEFFALLQDKAPEVIVVAAYGKLLPKNVLDLPGYGCLNVHASLLPRYRGAAPIQRVLMNGEEKTGVTIMLMDVGMDTGKMLAKAELKIEPEDNSGTLFAKLAKVGADLLIHTLPKWVNGEITAVEQNEAEATYAPMLKKEEELINWQNDAEKISWQIRGLAPEIYAYTYFRGKRLKIGECEVVETDFAEKAGTIVRADKKSLVVACASGALKLLAVQPEGKKMQRASDFLNGNSLSAGEVLGEQDGK